VSNREQIRHFPTDVVGVSLNNDDGTPRQEIIKRCRRFERLSLELEEGTLSGPLKKGTGSAPEPVLGIARNDDGGACPLFQRAVEGTPAVRVCRQNGEQIGCLRPEVARQVLARLQAGHKLTALLKDFTGEETPAKSRGVKLLIIEAESGVGDRKIDSYTRKLAAAGRTKPFNQVRLFVLVVVATTAALLIWC
jgi:hypothetical protein